MTALPHEPAPLDLPDPDDRAEFGMHELDEVRPWRSVREMLADWWRGRD